jgi:hypothetical protein
MGPNWGGGGGELVVSANEYSCAHAWNQNKLWRSNSIFNLYNVPAKYKQNDSLPVLAKHCMLFILLHALDMRGIRFHIYWECAV